MTSATVSWSRLSDGASPTWGELRPAPELNSGFTEATQYVFRKPGAGWLLRIDDEPIVDGPEPESWIWSPRFFAGEVTAELVREHCTIPFRIDVTPDSAKMGRDIFAEMVRELWDEDPALVIGTEPATRQIGELGANQDPWLEFARFRRYLPQFLSAMEAVRARPRRSLRVRRASVAWRRVRRVDNRTTTALAASPAAALLLGDVEAQGVLPADATLDVPQSEETLDSAANRAMLTLAIGLLRRGRNLHERLQTAVGRESASETTTALASRWPIRSQCLMDLAVKIKAVLRKAPFTEVLRPEITAAGLTAVAADPAYSRAWNRGWHALRHGVDAPSTSESIWMSPSWQIYERWCFLRLGRACSSASRTWQWSLDSSGMKWNGVSGGSRALLEFQPVFRSRGSRAERDAERWSVSRYRVPDLLLSISGEGRDPRFVVFDAKYRSSRANVLDAMASAHIYQDSLRIGTRRPEASFLLVPRGGGAPWLEDPNFQAAQRVGVVPFGPESQAGLPAVVVELLAA
jgi:hypothetical protein